jgi:hypothetical protein
MIRLLFISAIFFVGCSNVTITSNCDESADFNDYKTYSFAPPQNTTTTLHPEYDNPKNRKLIQTAIKGELTKIGYSEIISDGDLLLKFDVIITDKVDPRIDSAVVYKPWVDTKMDSFNYTEGLLIIRMIDQRKGNLIWQGSLSGVLNKEPNKFGQKLDQYVAKLFAALTEHMQ